ncbi:MAG: hypothetical protein IJH31_00265 [Erysipelotrichaceae bacterium]|nr:hypothetical protein [Erysipelotrichaceae bacterium]
MALISLIVVCIYYVLNIINNVILYGYANSFSSILILVLPNIVKAFCAVFIYFMVLGFCELIERAIKIDRKLSLLSKNNEKSE